MALSFFQATTVYPYPNSANKLGLNDYCAGSTSGQTNYPLTNNIFSGLLGTAQAEANNFYKESNPTGSNSMSSSGSSTAVLSPAPTTGSNLVFPGQNPGVLQAYDEGSPSQMIATGTFWVGDITDIASYQYSTPNVSGATGMLVSFINRINSTAVALPSWFQFAAMVSDMAIGGYLSAGTTYPATPVTAKGTLTVQAVNGNTSLTVSGWAPAVTTQPQLLMLGTGVNQEFVYLNSWSGGGPYTLTLSSLTPVQNTHVVGDVVYAIASGFGIKMTIPSGISGGTPVDWFNCSLDCQYQQGNRIG